MPYWQLFYHFVTATINRQPLLTPSVEPVIFMHVKEKCRALGVELFAVNGFEDHLHIIVAVPPRIAVASFIGQIKGYTSAQYAGEVLEKAGVIVAAGNAYGPDGEGYIRISLATPDDRLVEALERIKNEL